MGRPGRRRSHHHRRGDAGRKRFRPPAPDQKAAPRSAGHRHERAEHVHDRHQGVRARRLRISAKAIRPEGTRRRRRKRAVPPTGDVELAAADGPGGDPAGRPLTGDAGHLSRAGAADADGSDCDDHRRIRHRQGTRRQGPSRLRQAPAGTVRGGQHGGDSARTHRIRSVRTREGRLHRRHRAQHRPFRAGGRRHAVPR